MSAVILHGQLALVDDPREVIPTMSLEEEDDVPRKLALAKDWLPIYNDRRQVLYQVGTRVLDDAGDEYDIDDEGFPLFLDYSDSEEPKQERIPQPPKAHREADLKTYRTMQTQTPVRTSMSAIVSSRSVTVMNAV